MDNTIDETLVNNHYQSNASITKWYTDCHFFNPTFTQCEYNEHDEKLKIINAARSVKDKRRKMVQELSEMEQPISEYALDFINHMREIDPFIVDAFEVLGKETIEALKYNEKQINAAMILAERKGNKVIRLIKNEFKVGKRYTNETIVDKFTKIFNTLGIHPEKEIKASIILDYYQAVSFKSNGKRGYQLVSELI